jgi:hypothetical protein
MKTGFKKISIVLTLLAALGLSNCSHNYHGIRNEPTPINELDDIESEVPLSGNDLCLMSTYSAKQSLRRFNLEPSEFMLHIFTNTKIYSTPNQKEESDFDCEDGIFKSFGETIETAILSNLEVSAGCFHGTWISGDSQYYSSLVRSENNYPSLESLSEVTLNIEDFRKHVTHGGISYYEVLSIEKQYVEDIFQGYEVEMKVIPGNKSCSNQINEDNLLYQTDSALVRMSFPVMEITGL